MTTTAKHQILIVGGGTAGITVAARMLRKGYTDVAVIEPASKHYYQPSASSTCERDSERLPRRQLDIEYPHG
jgi:2-polyprenyl-6-methoxyphenol hydroxylase-like FAD-dependent oxidoreductase